MKAIGYVRVSTDEQAKSGLGLEAQIAKIKAYAELFDIELTEIIMDEGISGKTLERDGLKKAIKMLKDKKSEGMVIAKLDRLTRNVADLGTLVSNVFDKAELYSVSEQINTKNAAGRLVLNVLVSVAQWERETICERTKDALQAKKARGEKTGGNTPFGFNEVNGKLIRNEEEQSIISEIKTLKESGLSLRKIAGILNEKGIETKNGKAWTAVQIQRIAA
jgi:site-specific DNA recombinase